MRDPNRIDEYLKELGKIWHKYPDLRFSQMILNVLHEEFRGYYMEDNESIQLLKDFYGVKE